MLTAFTTLALFDTVLARRHGNPPWRRHHEHVDHGYGGQDHPEYQGHPTTGASGYHDGSGSYSSGSPAGYAGGATKAVQKVTGREFELVRRYEDCRFSFYDAGLGACGKVNSGSDFVSISLLPLYGLLILFACRLLR